MKSSLIRWIFLFFYFSSFHPLFSADILNGYFSKYLGINDGLPSRNITGITQDEKGIIWIGSRDRGLIRFDGFKFTTRFEDNTIPVVNETNEIFDVVSDYQGNILLAGSDGLLVFNPISGFKKKLLKYHKISALYKDHQGNLWASYDGKILFSKGGDVDDFKLFTEHTFEISAIMEDNQKRMWFFDINGHYLLLANKNNATLNEGLYLKDETGINYFQQIINLKGEVIGVNYFNLNNLRLPIQFSREGQFLKGFPKDGIPIYDIIQLPGFPYKEFMKFGKLEIKYFKDNLNTIWIGTGYGIILLKKKSVHFNKIKELKGISTRGILEKENGNIIIGSYSGLYERDIKTKKTRQLTLQGRFNICFKPIHIKGDMLFTTMENYLGFGIIDLKKNKIINDETLTFSSIGLGFRGAYYDKNRDLIFTGDATIYQINPKNLTITPLPFEYPNKNLQLFDFLKRDSSSFYIGTDHGLLLFDLHKGWLPNHFAVNKIQSDIDIRINHIFRNGKGQLWLSTNQMGVVLFDPRTNKVLKKIAVKEGLPSNEIYAIYSSDGGKNLWLSTANGISLINTGSKTINNFNTNDGLPGNEFNTISHLKAKNGMIHFGGTEGVTFFNPNNITSTNTLKPLPFISEIKIFDSKEGREKLLSQNNPIILKWHHSPLQIYLGGNDYFDFENQTYRYQLMGYNNTWQYTKGQNPIQYDKLPQGKYTLKIQMRSSYSGWNGQIVHLKITQQPVWYKQTFVILLILLSIFFILYLLVINKLNQLEKEHNIRLEIAEDLHDRMGSMIFSINYRANKLLPQEQNKEDTLSNELNQIIKECGRINSAISDIIWAIDLGKQKFKDLITRFQDYSDKYLLEKGIKVVYQMSPYIPSEKSLTLSIRHQLMMIFTEALQNILKHAPESEVFIHINYEKNYLNLEIMNTFPSKSLTTFSSGHGINIMKKRAQRMMANIEFKNESHSFLVSITVKV
jgi:ligand-binding sensor domain-containing protein